MQVVCLTIALAEITMCLAICLRELFVAYYNPIPKFDDSDKNINQISFLKTRSIL